MWKAELPHLAQNLQFLIPCWSRHWCCWREYLKGDGDSRCERTVWTAGAGEFRSHIWGTGCNMGACCIPLGNSANALVLGSTSVLLESQSHIPHLAQWKVHVQRLSVIFILGCICLSSPQEEPRGSGLDFHLDKKCWCCPSVHQERAFLLERKGQKTPVCVCLWNTHCVLRGQRALVKIQSEEEFIRWFGSWKGLHARGKVLAPFAASLSALFYEKVGELCGITQETSHDGLVPSYMQIYCSIKPFLPAEPDRRGVNSGTALFLKGLPWTKTRVSSGLGCTS